MIIIQSRLLWVDGIDLWAIVHLWITPLCERCNILELCALIYKHYIRILSFCWKFMLHEYLYMNIYMCQYVVCCCLLIHVQFVFFLYVVCFIFAYILFSYRWPLLLFAIVVDSGWTPPCFKEWVTMELGRQQWCGRVKTLIGVQMPWGFISHTQ